MRRWMLDHVASDDEPFSPSPSPVAGVRDLGLHAAWLPFLQLTPRQVDALCRTKRHVVTERKRLTVYPPEQQVHRWSFLCRPYHVRVVIVGQEPACDGSANGLAFATNPGRPPSPALQAIYQELARTVPEFRAPTHGCVDAWCREGVLLLNSTFTVVRGQPRSHETVGWDVLSRRVLCALSKQRYGLVFMLWGAAAQECEFLLDPIRHLILRAHHPHPVDALDQSGSPRGPHFLGCNHFVEANNYLLRTGMPPVDWAVVCPSTAESRRPRIPLLTGALPSDEDDSDEETDPSDSSQRQPKERYRDSSVFFV